jgi:hypothetical protein
VASERARARCRETTLQVRTLLHTGVLPERTLAYLAAALAHASTPLLQAVVTAATAPPPSRGVHMDAALAAAAATAPTKLPAVTVAAATAFPGDGGGEASAAAAAAVLAVLEGVVWGVRISGSRRLAHQVRDDACL